MRQRMPKSRTHPLLPLWALVVVVATLSFAVGEPQLDGALPFDPSKLLTEPERADRLKRVQPGLSPDQVRQLLGPPQRTARQILYHRAREQWLYEAPFSIRLDFEYVRGQEPYLLSVQPTTAAKP
jgi:hypothetical protein